jgi:16S rRNA (cytidine1402-2'-O)-methyltransferase
LALHLIATPIGNPDDISLRALKLFKEAEVFILEERKAGFAALKPFSIKPLQFFELNEHTSVDEVNEIFQACRDKNTVLISDCGTPNFCDPGHQLVAKYRAAKLKVVSVPGASSLMLLLSLVGQRVYSFQFLGFLPAKTELRAPFWLNLKKQKKETFVTLDTPYRFRKTLEDLKEHLSDRKVLLAMNLTTPEEEIFEGLVSQIKISDMPEKAEFIVLIYGE